jgi:hypothetical protein
MRTLLTSVALVLLIACEPQAARHDLPDATCGYFPWEDCVAIPSPCDHVADGQFTAWDGPGDQEHEWGSKCVIRTLQGVYATMYIAYHKKHIFFLNDWHLDQEGPIPADCFNLFYLNLGGHALEIRVYGDQTIRVWDNGQDISDQAAGAAGFGVSPEQPDTPHTIFEFIVPAVYHGNFSLCELDPSTNNSCSQPEDLTQEPTIVKGVLTEDEGVEQFGGEAGVPNLNTLSAFAARSGDAVTVNGVNLGSPGRVLVGTVAATIQAWTPKAITFEVPPIPNGTHDLRVVRDDQQEAAPLTLKVSCPVDCDGRNCGDDGCGGVCGTCQASQECGKNGRCMTP